MAKFRTQRREADLGRRSGAAQNGVPTVQLSSRSARSALAQLREERSPKAAAVTRTVAGFSSTAVGAGRCRRRACGDRASRIAICFDRRVGIDDDGACSRTPRWTNRGAPARRRRGAAADGVVDGRLPRLSAARVPRRTALPG
jgi:hypothetical protein